jgi:hypothetical protein
MADNDLLILAFGLFLGYWIVFNLFGSHDAGQEDQVRDQPANPQTAGIAAQNAESSQLSEPSKTKPLSCHDILGIKPDASFEAIHLAYRQLAEPRSGEGIAKLSESERHIASEELVKIDHAYSEALAQARTLK